MFGCWDFSLKEQIVSFTTDWIVLLEFYDWDLVICAVLDLLLGLQDSQSLILTYDILHLLHSIFRFLLVLLFMLILYVRAFNAISISLVASLPMNKVQVYFPESKLNFRVGL